MSFTCLQLFLFCSFLVFISTVRTDAKPIEDSKSYINVLNRIVSCENPATPFMKHPKGFLDVRVKGNIMIGNITFTEKVNNIQGTLQDMYYIDGKWQTNFIARNISCHSKIVSIALEFIGFRYDKKKCSAATGSYVFEIDYNKLDHLWSPLRWYGRMIRRLEARCQAGTIFCRHFESEVKPAR